jgi:hypothetical protein
LFRVKAVVGWTTWSGNSIKPGAFLLQDCSIYFYHHQLLPPLPNSTTPTLHAANMHFSAAILALAATVSAVDLRSYTTTGCTGGWVGCLGINPGVCCVFSEGAGSGRLSVSVNAVSEPSLLLLTELTDFNRSPVNGASRERLTPAVAADTSQTSRTPTATPTFA